MKGVILCGNSCSDMRLRPITCSIPRSMIQIANIPFIEYLIKEMTVCGITNIAMVVGEDRRDFSSYFKDGRDFNCKIKYYSQTKDFGDARQLLCAKHFVDDDSFLLALGSSFIDFSLEKYLKEFRSSKDDAFLLLKEIENPWKYDIAIFEKGKLIEIIKKPKITNSKTAVAGIYFFTPSIFKAASRIKPSRRGEYELTDAIQYLIDRDYKIGTSMLEGTWVDIVKEQDLLDCNKHILSGEENKSMIGEETKLENSTIGDFCSIGKRCSIKNAVINNSIIMDDCIIDGVEINDSIVCNYSTIIGHGSINGVMGTKTKLFINTSEDS